jgi:hypothetical protein
VVVVAETIILLICNIFAVSFHLLPLLQHRPAAASLEWNCSPKNGRMLNRQGLENSVTWYLRRTMIWLSGNRDTEARTQQTIIIIIPQAPRS